MAGRFNPELSYEPFDPKPPSADIDIESLQDALIGLQLRCLIALVTDEQDLSKYSEIQRRIGIIQERLDSINTDTLP